MSEAAEDRLGAAPAAAPTLSRQVSRAMLWNAVLQPARILAGLLSGLVVVNVLTRQEYSTIAVLGALAAILGLVTDFGIERGLVKFLPEIEARHGREGVRRVIAIVIWQKLALLAALALLALAFHERFFAFWRARLGREAEALALLDAYRWVFFAALLALLVFGALFDVYMQALVSYFRQRAWNSINLVTTLLKPLLLIGVVLLGWGALGVIGATVAIAVVATALALWQTVTLRRGLAERPVQAAAGARLRSRFVKYCALSYWIQVTELAYSVEFVLLVLSGASAVAGFKFAFSIVSQILTALWSPLVGVQIPLFARLHARGDDRQLGEAYAILSKFLAALMIPAAVGLALLAGNLIAVLAPKYAGFGPVGAIIAVFLCLDAAISVPLAILMAYERYPPLLIARTSALLAIPLLLLVAPRYGPIGAALVMGGARLACDGLAMALALRQLPLRYPWRFAGRVLGASAAMAAVVAPLAFLALDPAADPSRAARSLYLAGNLALGGLGAAVFLGAFRLTGGLDPADRRRIRDLRLPAASLLLRFF